MDLDQELERLAKEGLKLGEEIARVDAMLGNQDFMGKAPDRVIQLQKEKRVQYQVQLDKVEAQLDLLKKSF